MPDLVTHITISHLLKRPFEFKTTDTNTAPLRILLYLGTILPDILSRPWYILIPATRDWTILFHTPIGMVIFACFLSLLFEQDIRSKARTHLIAGIILHFLLDSFQKKILAGISWLWPFSWKNFGYGIIEAGDVLSYIPYWIGLVIIMEISLLVWRKLINRS